MAESVPVPVTDSPAETAAEGLGFVVHVLLGIDATGKTDEATQERPTLDEAFALARSVPDAIPSWRVVSIFRAEDFSRVMQGAMTEGVGRA